MSAAADPTQELDLIHKKEVARANPLFHALAEDLAQKRVALILSGGGGKGAYQAGAILALYDLGIFTFTSIVGTSVGSLNAALFHELVRTGKRDHLVNLWTTITPQTVMVTSWWRPLLKVILYLPLPATGSAQPHRVILDLQDTDFEYDGFILGTVALLGWVLSLTAALGLSGLLLIAAGKAFSPYLSPLIGVVLLLGLPRLMSFIASRFSGFNNAPLTEIVNKLDIDDIRVNPPHLILTMAEEISVLSLFTNRVRPRAIYCPIDSNVPPSLAKQVLRHSAALPEIFPTTLRLGGVRMVDGGVADNTPVLGAATDFPDVTIVVYLDNRFGRVSRQRLVDKEKDRLRALAQLRRSEWGEATYQRYSQWISDLRILAIVPSQNLGNFIKGTLDFSADGAYRRMKLGYLDALQEAITQSPLR
jgi:Patatin-like phospholipase